jgi:hypothetical protein
MKILQKMLMIVMVGVCCYLESLQVLNLRAELCKGFYVIYKSI